MTDFALDLTQYHFKRERGDIVVYGTWMGKELDPVLVLVPAKRVGRVIPCVIPISSSWQWSRIIGDELHCIRTAGAFASLLGLDSLSKSTVYRIMGIIQDELIDVLAMPIKPTTEFVAADAIRTDHDTGKVTHQEIIDRV